MGPSLNSAINGFLKAVENLRAEAIKYAAKPDCNPDILRLKTENIAALVAFYRATGLYISDLELENFAANLAVLNEFKQRAKFVKQAAGLLRTTKQFKIR